MTVAKNPNKISDSLITILTDRLRDEYTAYFFYQNAMNWCRDKGYNKAADFFKEEAEGELEHANKLQSFMVDWNVYPTLPSINARIQFTDLIDIINKAYAIEFNLFEAYKASVTTARDLDLNVEMLLREYVRIQNDEVVEYSDLLNASKLVNVDNQFEVLYFEQTYFN